MADKDVFLYVGTYKSEDDARADYDVVKALHDEGVIGTYDMAIVSKDDQDKIHVKKHEKPTEHGELIDEGQAALVIVGESKFQEYMDRAFARAQRRVDRQIKADSKAVQKELDKASKQQV